MSWISVDIELPDKSCRVEVKFDDNSRDIGQWTRSGQGGAFHSFIRNGDKIWSVHGRTSFSQVGKLKVRYWRKRDH